MKGSCKEIFDLALTLFACGHVLPRGKKETQEAHVCSQPGKSNQNQWLSNYSIKQSPGGPVKMQNPGTPSPENTDLEGLGGAREFMVITSSQVLLMP